MNTPQNYQLPLFPLQTVLFPTVPINLHIFEPRYRQMIGTCIENKTPFGIVLIKEGTEALGPMAAAYNIGCTAEIIHVEKLSQGRMNITAVGKNRFQILKTQDNLPYLTGIVANLTLHNQNTPGFVSNTLQLHSQVKNYLKKFSEAVGKSFSPNIIPTDPVAKTYLSASLLQIPLPEKQNILEINDATKLVATLQSLYYRESSLLQVLIRPEGKSQGSFGLN